jgi:hypothetical protein
MYRAATVYQLVIRNIIRHGCIGILTVTKSFWKGRDIQNDYFDSILDQRFGDFLPDPGASSSHHCDLFLPAPSTSIGEPPIVSRELGKLRAEIVYRSDPKGPFSERGNSGLTERQ